MRFYKYVSTSNAAVNMATGSLKFTPIAELNDPTELTPTVNYESVKDSLLQLRKRGMTTDQFEWLHREEALLRLLCPEQQKARAPHSIVEADAMVHSRYYDNVLRIESDLTEATEIIKAKVGVLSLSTRYNSLSMWIHYAAGATGFVVAIDGLEAVYAGDDTGSLNIPKEVRYADDFPGVTYDPTTQDRLFFSKLSDWSYEQEWRVVRPLAECIREGDHYLDRLTRPLVQSVICGWKTPKAEVEALVARLSNMKSEAEVVLAKLDRGRIVLEPY